MQTELLFDLPAMLGRKQIRLPEGIRPVWSENKAALVAKYLYYFALVAKHGTYIDGFAGPQRAIGSDRLWTARLVLESEPKWFTTFMLCDVNPAQARHLRELAEAPSAYSTPPGPRRRIEIFQGDFNREIGTILLRSQIGEKRAAFCLLDQRTFECEWTTLEALAQWKKTGLKIELFYFMCAGWFGRAIKATRNTAMIDRWWGRKDWQEIVDMNCHKRAAMMCDRFRAELGYAYAAQFPIYSGPRTRRVMYSMIHASDHRAAIPLMARAYRRAVEPESAEQLQLEFGELNGMGYKGAGDEAAVVAVLAGQ